MPNFQKTDIYMPARHPTRWRPIFQYQSPDLTYWKSARLPKRLVSEIVIQNLFLLLATTVFWGATDLKSFFQSWELC